MAAAILRNNFKLIIKQVQNMTIIKLKINENSNLLNFQSITKIY